MSLFVRDLNIEMSQGNYTSIKVDIISDTTSIDIDNVISYINNYSRSPANPDVSTRTSTRNNSIITPRIRESIIEEDDFISGDEERIEEGMSELTPKKEHIKKTTNNPIEELEL